MEAATATLATQPWTSRALNRLRPDRALVDRFRGGDESAFEVLHDRHEARVLGLCIGMRGRSRSAAAPCRSGSPSRSTVAAALRRSAGIFAAARTAAASARG